MIQTVIVTSVHAHFQTWLCFVIVEHVAVVVIVVHVAVVIVVVVAVAALVKVVGVVGVVVLA